MGGQPSARPGTRLTRSSHLGDLEVQRVGDTGPVVIALHGMSSSPVILREWDGCAEACALQGFQVWLPNFHSNGRAAPSEGCSEQVRLVEELVASAEEVILMGKSWGGALAAKAARRAGVRGLVLVCPALAKAELAKEPWPKPCWEWF